MKPTHRLSRTTEYVAWMAMKTRCLNKNSERYPDWGGRGIAIAAEWVSDFPAFLKHIGPRPSPQHSIDRIDNTRGYEPGNVRWSVRLQQMRNTRHNRVITFNGKTQCVSAWCEELSLPTEVVYSRLKHGWNEHEALATPYRFQQNQKRDSKGRYDRNY